VSDTLVALTPVVAGFLAGHALRRIRFAGEPEGRFLLLLNLYVCMPALVLSALVEVRLTADLAVFPAAALAMVGAGYIVARLAVRRRDRPDTERAVLVIGFMVVNSAFALPFVEALYGRPGVVRLAAFDLVNSVLVLTVVFAVAARANPDRQVVAAPVSQLLRAPSLWVIGAGVVVNLVDRSLPAAPIAVFDTFGAASPFLVAVGTGVLFVPAGGAIRRALAFAGARLLVGVAAAMTIVIALRLEGADRGVLLLLGVAPLGFVIVAFASVEKLDVELATQALAVSLVASFGLSILVSLVVG
jgi:hypothetical protein